MEFRKKRHCVYLLAYHAVFVVKYRKKVISRDMADYMKNHAGRILEKPGGQVIEMAADKDHVHLLFELPPTIAPSTAVCSLKTQLSKKLREQFHDRILLCLYGDAFWSSSYFICTNGGVTLETLKQYVQSQVTEGHQRKYKNRPKKNAKTLSSPPG